MRIISNQDITYPHKPSTIASFLDQSYESCEVSTSQERALSKRFFIYVCRPSLKALSQASVFSVCTTKLYNISKFQTFMSKKFTPIFNYDDFSQQNLVISQSTRHHYLCLLASKHQVFAKQTDRARWCVGSPTRSPTFFPCYCRRLVNKTKYFPLTTSKSHLRHLW